jgi:hypothetical protein
LLKALDEGWDEVTDALALHNGEDLRQPLPGSDWSVLDHLGHLATWAEICERHIPDVLAGRSPELGVASFSETYNYEAVAAKAGWDAARVRQDAEACHGRLRNTVAGLEDTDLECAATVNGERETVSSWVWAEAPEHYFEHAATLRGESPA